MPLHNERYFDIKDAAKESGYSVAQVKLAISNGNLEAMKIADGIGRYGFKYMVTESNLKKWANDSSMHGRGRKPKKIPSIIETHYLREEPKLHVNDLISEEPVSINGFLSSFEARLKDSYSRGYSDGYREAMKHLMEYAQDHINKGGSL